MYSKLKARQTTFYRQAAPLSKALYPSRAESKEQLGKLARHFVG